MFAKVEGADPFYLARHKFQPVTYMHSIHTIQVSIKSYSILIMLWIWNVCERNKLNFVEILLHWMHVICDKTAHLFTCVTWVQISNPHSSTSGVQWFWLALGIRLCRGMKISQHSIVITVTIFSMKESGGYGQRWNQALLSLYPFFWLKLSRHFWYMCGLFFDVWMLSMTAAMSESVAYFISAVSGYRLLLAHQLCV